MTPLSKPASHEAQPNLLVVKAMGEDPLFKPGDAVKVSVRYPVGHYRVPHFIRGKRGWVEMTISPPAINNEEEGFGRNAGIKGHYYRVALPLAELWPDYVGLPEDNLRIEIFQTRLERI